MGNVEVKQSKEFIISLVQPSSQQHTLGTRYFLLFSLAIRRIS